MKTDKRSVKNFKDGKREGLLVGGIKTDKEES